LVKPIKATMSKVVLITGGSSGIGKAIESFYITRALLSMELAETQNGVEFYFSASYFRCQKSESIQAAVAKIIKLRQIRYCINNAGVGITGPLEEIPSEEIKITLRLTSSDLLK
jgi:NAD(P)-dependent dehydrogenase (short-subunit alcohol dehydrogenase family)